MKNESFTQIIQQYRKQALLNFINDFLPILEQNGFEIEDLLNALADYMFASKNQDLNECVPFFEQAINHLLEAKKQRVKQ